MATSIPGSQVRVGGRVDWLAGDLAHTHALMSLGKRAVLVRNAASV